jgi:hypothetical protein
LSKLLQQTREEVLCLLLILPLEVAISQALKVRSLVKFIIHPRAGYCLIFVSDLHLEGLREHTPMERFKGVENSKRTHKADSQLVLCLDL